MAAREDHSDSVPFCLSFSQKKHCSFLPASITLNHNSIQFLSLGIHLFIFQFSFVYLLHSSSLFFYLFIHSLIYLFVHFHFLLILSLSFWSSPLSRLSFPHLFFCGFCFHFFSLFFFFFFLLSPLSQCVISTAGSSNAAAVRHLVLSRQRR